MNWSYHHDNESGSYVIMQDVTAWHPTGHPLNGILVATTEEDEDADLLRARLIAAAPELLAACEKIAQLPHSNPSGDTLHGPCPRCIAEAVIAKAKRGAL